MIDRYPGEQLIPSPRVLATPLLNLAIAILAAAVVIAVLARFLPRTSVYRRFVLSTTNPPGPSLSGAQRQFVNPLRIASGMNGVALTTLRPSGKARFADQVVDVVTQGEYIAPETRVSVVTVDGMRVVVRTAA
jgi:membrane-bound serine protease (ClpP class)